MKIGSMVQELSLKIYQRKTLEETTVLQLIMTTMILKYQGRSAKLKTEITSDSLKLSSSLKYENDWMHLMFSTKDTTQQAFIRVNAKILSSVETISGTATLLDGTTPSIQISRINSSFFKRCEI